MFVSVFEEEPLVERFDNVETMLLVQSQAMRRHIACR